MLKLPLARLLVRLGRRPAPPVEVLEQRHDDPSVPLSNDSSYVCGRGEDGTSFIARLAFRGARPPECWLGLSRPGAPQLVRQEPPGPTGDGFVQGPLSWVCEAPGERWRLRFDGPVPDVHGETHALGLDLVFEGAHPLVEFGQVTDVESVARTVAGHPWSRAFFSRLRETHSVHYEQGGTLRGRVTVDGETTEVDWQSVRDHSWGVRDWNRWDQHLWLFGRLRDGRTFNVSMIRYDALPVLRAGFLAANGTPLPLSDCSPFEGFQQERMAPERFEVTARWGGRESRVAVEVPDAFSLDMDGDAYHIDEGMARFDVDGVPGIGVAEIGWGPRHA